ncbi:MAG TPA: undecaprenyl-diphosphate phosphatase [Terracidiphilus sp.]|nr:undecaprenyl-diphosphate phosphatase [Terracidiphilus sp.]
MPRKPLEEGELSPYLISTLLGIVEGLTEFLPVSSTAHLRIAEALMKLPLDDPYWKMYTVVIQLGAILALCLLFLARILEFLRTFPEGEDGRHTRLNHPLSLVLIAFVCTALPALLLHKWSEKNLGSLTAMALALLVGGIAMWVVDVWSERRDAETTHVEQMNLFQAIWIGLCQTLSAIFPGTSRSMSTIAAGQLVGLDRPTALEFSFLISIPTMITATGWDLLKEIHRSKVVGAAGLAAAHVAMNSERWIVLIIGTAVSFIVALGVVEWFLMWVRRHGFAIFALYRILLGIAMLLFGAKWIGG